MKTYENFVDVFDNFETYESLYLAPLYFKCKPPHWFGTYFSFL